MSGVGCEIGLLVTSRVVYWGWVVYSLRCPGCGTTGSLSVPRGAHDEDRLLGQMSEAHRGG